MTLQSLLLAVCTWCGTMSPAIAHTNVPECYTTKQEFRIAHPTEHMYHTDRFTVHRRCYHAGIGGHHRTKVQQVQPLKESTPADWSTAHRIRFQRNLEETHYKWKTWRLE